MTSVRPSPDRERVLSHDENSSAVTDHTGPGELVDQILLKHHKIVGVRRIPADADDVISHGNSEMNEFPLMVHALAADVFVPVILGPRLLCFLKLPPDAMAANISHHRSQPV